MSEHLIHHEDSMTQRCKSNTVVINDINNDLNLFNGINSNIFQTIFDQAVQSIFVLDTKGQVLIANKTSFVFFNSAKEDLVGKKIWDTPLWNKSSETKATIKEAFEKIFNGECVQLESKYISSDNKVQYIDVTLKPILDKNDQVKMIIHEGFDVTYRKDNENYLQEIATHDSLTGLPNKRLLHDRLNHALLRSRRNNTLLGVLFIDLDGFKEINDNYGHDVGDLLLQAVSMRLMDTIRENDTLARIGGDEFVILLEDVKELHHIISVSERIVSEMKKSYVTNDINCSSLTASIGVSIFPYDGTDSDMLLKKADHAMYQVKNGSKNDYKIFV